MFVLRIKSESLMSLLLIEGIPALASSTFFADDLKPDKPTLIVSSFFNAKAVLNTSKSPIEPPSRK